MFTIKLVPVGLANREAAAAEIAPTTVVANLAEVEHLLGNYATLPKIEYQGAPESVEAMVFADDGHLLTDDEFFAALYN